MKSNALTPYIEFPFALARRPAGAPPAAAVAADADETIRRALLVCLQRQPWWDASRSNVFVDHGTVVYQGLAGDARSRRAARQLALDLPGVRDVWDARIPRREWQAMT